MWEVPDVGEVLLVLEVLDVLDVLEVREVPGSMEGPVCIAQRKMNPQKPKPKNLKTLFCMFCQPKNEHFHM